MDEAMKRESQRITEDKFRLLREVAERRSQRLEEAPIMSDKDIAVEQWVPKRGDRVTVKQEREVYGDGTVISCEGDTIKIAWDSDPRVCWSFANDIQPLSSLRQPSTDTPIDMLLHCPMCQLQHIDEASDSWTNPPHRSHLCFGCGHIWRPADVPTNGVRGIKTRGKADSLIEQSSTDATVEDGKVGTIPEDGPFGVHLDADIDRDGLYGTSTLANCQVAELLSELRIARATLQSHSPRADAAEARVRELNDSFRQSRDIGLAFQRRALAAEAERNKLRKILSLALEYPAAPPMIWGDQARQALASITDEKSAESGRVE